MDVGSGPIATHCEHQVRHSARLLGNGKLTQPSSSRDSCLGTDQATTQKVRKIVDPTSVEVQVRNDDRSMLRNQGLSPKALSDRVLPFLCISRSRAWLQNKCAPKASEFSTASVACILMPMVVQGKRCGRKTLHGARNLPTMRWPIKKRMQAKKLAAHRPSCSGPCS